MITTAQEKTLQVGDVLEAQWGYEQTNVDFYQVVGFTKTMIRLQKIESESSPEDGFMTAEKVAKPNAFVGKPFVRKYGGKEYVSLNTYTGARKWDGEPVRYSWYG